MIVQGAEDTALALVGRRLARSSVPVVFDVHGDWRNSTRVYGSPGRKVVSPLADGLASLALRRADGVRTVSGFTSSLVRERGVEPIATFPAYMDLDPFLASPPMPIPAQPTALFVGVLERYKGLDILAAAWRQLQVVRPGVHLHIVGAGRLESIVRSLADDPSLRTRWTERLGTPGVSKALDEATLLVLPSRREGMGRVIVEAFCRGRPVVGTRSGGIADLVDDDVTGLLVPPEDPEALAAALDRVLGDAALAERLGEGASAASSAWAATPEEFARRMRELVDAVLARSSS
jgi:glycosyltransferase involved in cell wall biosynthesis